MAEAKDLWLEAWRGGQASSAGFHQWFTMKDRDGDQRGGSEWEPIKILPTKNSAYVPKSLPSVLHSCCQDHIAITMLLTSGTTHEPKHSTHAAEQTTWVQGPALVRLATRPGQTASLIYFSKLVLNLSSRPRWKSQAVEQTGRSEIRTEAQSKP